MYVCYWLRKCFLVVILLLSACVLMVLPWEIAFKTCSSQWYNNTWQTVFHKLVLRYGISRNFVVAYLVLQLWLSAQYFSLEKDLAIFSFCSIWFRKKTIMRKHTLSLNLSILRFLHFSFVESWRFLKVIFLKTRFWSTFDLITFSAFVWSHSWAS